MEEIYRGYKIEIENNGEFAENPRDWDNIGTMICKHSGYGLGDVDESKKYKKCGDSVQNDMATYFFNKYFDEINKEYEIEEDYYVEGGLDEEDTEKIYFWIEKNVILLPLYLYEHSGLRMKIGSFSGLLPQGHAEFDSGQVGFIYITKDNVKKNIKSRLTKKDIEKVVECLEKEVEVYDQYIMGDVYSYSIEETNDSRGGYYGSDHEKSGLLDDAKSCIDNHISKKTSACVVKLKKMISNKVPLQYRKAFCVKGSH